jgi:uncharacterized protein with PQ loop repeat
MKKIFLFLFIFFIFASFLFSFYIVLNNLELLEEDHASYLRVLFYGI